jgi:hypothetical protein
MANETRGQKVHQDHRPGAAAPPEPKDPKKTSVLPLILGLPGKIITLLLLILIIGAGVYWFGFGGEQAFQNFMGRVEVQASRSLLVEVLPKNELITARGTFSYIFPFDFWESGTMRELREGRTLALLSRPAPRIVYLQKIFDWAQENDFSLIAPQEFYLIQTEVDLGFRIESEAWSVLDQGGQIILEHPPVEMLSFRIVERDWSQEGFPDFELPIEAWRDLLVILDQELRLRSQPPELWRRAEEGLKRFFRGLPGTDQWLLRPSSPGSE